MRTVRYLAVAAAAALTMLGCTGASADTTCPTAFGSYVSCVQMPANTSTPMVGEEITAGANSAVGTPWMVTDASGAPMAWLDLYGLYAFGNGGKDAGGMICSTYVFQAWVACLTPEGTLSLTPTGPDGLTGSAVTLTARDVSFLHCLEHSTPYYCRTALAAGKLGGKP